MIVIKNQNRTETKLKMPSDFRQIRRNEWVTVIILFFINLINYMDRFTVAGNYKYFICVFLCLYIILSYLYTFMIYNVFVFILLTPINI